MQQAHHKSLLAQMAFSTYFLSKGYTVLTAINPSSSFDLVLDRRGKFLKIKVKYLTVKNGILRIEVGKKLKRVRNRFDKNPDFLGIYSDPDKKMYLIPYKETKNKGEIWLRVRDTKNRQEKKINLAKKWEVNGA